MGLCPTKNYIELIVETKLSVQAKSGLIVKTEGYITDRLRVDTELSVTLVMDNGGERGEFLNETPSSLSDPIGSLDILGVLCLSVSKCDIPNSPPYIQSIPDQPRLNPGKYFKKNWDKTVLKCCLRFLNLFFNFDSNIVLKKFYLN